MPVMCDCVFGGEMSGTSLHIAQQQELKNSLTYNAIQPEDLLGPSLAASMFALSDVVVFCVVYRQDRPESHNGSSISAQWCPHTP